MLRNDMYREQVVGESIDLPTQVDANRRQKYFPFTRSAFLSPSKWKYALIISAISLVLIYASPVMTFRESSQPSIRRYPIPKPALANPNQFNDKTYRIATHYFNKYQRIIRNKRYMTVIDYTKPSSAKRMSIIDLKTHQVERHLVAHGKNSGVGYANDFSNRLNSYKSCRGLFLTGSAYFGTHGKSLHLLGLERGVNDHALDRGIVIHGANYVNSRSVMLNGGFLGRSWGCPAVPIKEVDQIVDKIRNGSLLYIHGTS
jgi:hypothetical protein